VLTPELVSEILGLERWNQSLKTDCIRPKTPLSLEDARRIVSDFVHRNGLIGKRKDVYLSMFGETETGNAGERPVEG
jgi:hypothetical protein